MTKNLTYDEKVTHIIERLLKYNSVVVSKENKYLGETFQDVVDLDDVEYVCLFFCCMIKLIVRHKIFSYNVVKFNTNLADRFFLEIRDNTSNIKPWADKFLEGWFDVYVENNETYKNLIKENSK